MHLAQFHFFGESLMACSTPCHLDPAKMGKIKSLVVAKFGTRCSVADNDLWDLWKCRTAIRRKCKRLKGHDHVDEHVRFSGYLPCILYLYLIIAASYSSFRGRSTLQVPVVCVYKLNKTSTTASIAERAFPWKHKALSLVHEEP